MRHSPITKTVRPPIPHLADADYEVKRFRAWYNEGELDGDRMEGLLDKTDVLVDQCRFLEDKLKIRVSPPFPS